MQDVAAMLDHMGHVREGGQEEEVIAGDYCCMFWEIFQEYYIHMALGEKYKCSYVIKESSNIFSNRVDLD